MVTLKESVDILTPYERLLAWADNFREEFVKWSPYHIECEMYDGGYDKGIVPYWVTFFAFELSVMIGWIALIWRGTFALKKTWILASPLIVAGIGYLLEVLIPWPFNGFVSGFESFGWMVMFLGGRKLVSQAMLEQRETGGRT